jgi:hypothetical protein
MNAQPDFSFFSETLDKVRRLKSNSWPWYIVRGAQETGSAEQLASLPRIITKTESGGGEHIFDTTSYATSPGHELHKLQEMVG